MSKFEAVLAKRLTKEDLSQICRLHGQTLPASQLSFLGPAFLEIYYGTITRSSKDFLFIAGVKKIQSVAVLSFDSTGLMRRVFLSNLFSVGFILLLWKARARVRKVFNEARQSPPMLPELAGLPEVVQFFTAGESQGKGIGTEILEVIENFLKERNHRGYYVKTLNQPVNPAIGFYERKGFRKLSGSASENDEYLYLVKRFSPS